jgi:hypothetical protein
MERGMDKIDFQNLPLIPREKFFRVCEEEEFQLKLGGYIWRIHKSDPDKIWPSNPHGDGVDAKVKVSIVDGRIFDRNTKKQVGRLKEKELINLRKEAASRGFSLPAMAYQDQVTE